VRVTVLEAIQKSAEFLAKKNVESPRLQTELLLAHLLKLPRMKLYLNFDRVLSPAETDALRELVKRRGLREPLQHIVGSTSFCGFEIKVNRHTLIPRPETELLAEQGWQWLQSRQAISAPPTALDYGTGSGCIAITLAAKCPTASITALDISEAALATARENAAANKVADKIHFMHSNGFAVLAAQASRPRVDLDKPDTQTITSQPAQSFDLIITNPPYIASAEIETLDPEVRDFDPRGALDGGADGLNFYRALAAESKSFLKQEGKIMMEFGDGQAEAIKTIFENEKWIVEAVKEDYSQRARILIARIKAL